MPLRNAGTICGKGVFVYIGKRQAVYIRLNEGKVVYLFYETGNIRLEHDSLCRGMEPADGMV